MGHVNLALRHEDALSGSSADDVEDYVGSMSFNDYRKTAARHFPFVLPLVDPNRVQGRSFRDYVEWMNDVSWEFEGQNGGRGEAYNLAQQNSDNRRVGTLALLQLFSVSGKALLGPDAIIVDALGGDGTITRFLRSQGIKGPRIISADLSGYMVNACLAQDFPCIRQSADKSLLRDSSVDGVLIAYGSHHLDHNGRKDASAEAFRTIKNGGRFVLHDFEIGTPAADWFDKVVHPFSRTGHPHPHFTQKEMQGLLTEAGFRNVRVFSMPDPFILRGSSSEEAHKNALIHLHRMYDLVKIPGDEKQVLQQLAVYARAILGEIKIEPTPNGYTATVPRQALVAVGTKLG